MGYKLTVIPKMLALFRGLAASKLYGRPLFVSHLITTRCDCSCPMCLWKDQSSNDEMSADEIGRFYRDLRKNGFVQVGIWGGEPLLREDAGEILRHAREAGLISVLVTNGYYLEERLEELAPNTNAVIVSLDYAGEEHDRLRGCPGLYDRVISALERLRRQYPQIKVYFNYLLHRGNEDQALPLAEIARDLDVSFYACPVKGESYRDRGKKAEEWKAGEENESTVSSLLIDLKRRGYPINNSYTYLREYLRDKEPFTCHLPKISIMVYPNGDVVNCLNRDVPLGNVRKQTVEEILKSPASSELKKAALNCNHCNNPNVVDTSFMWELRGEPLLNAFRTLLNR